MKNKGSSFLLSLGILIATIACLTGLSIPDSTPTSAATADIVLTGLIQTLTAAPGSTAGAMASPTAIHPSATLIQALTFTPGPSITPFQSATPTSSKTPIPSLTPIPTLTPILSDTPLIAGTDTPGTPTVEYACKYVSQKPVSGTAFPTHSSFHVVWVIANAGTKPWNAGAVTLVYVSGSKLQAGPKVIDLLEPIDPGENGNFSVDMIVPKTPGYYKTTWGLNAVSTNTVFCMFSILIVAS